MTKRLTALLMAIVLLFTLGSTSYACDENQSNDYVTQILFGERAYGKASDEKTKMLMSALYLCCEQADDQGQDKIDYLKSKKVSGVPSCKDINVRSSELLESSHNYWGYEYPVAKKIRANRKKVLRNTVNKVFDFGFINNLFGSNKGKCDSFAAMLYYSHILADYLADDPSDSEAIVNDKLVSSYSGEPYTIINGNKPTFSSYDMSRTTSFVIYRGLDNYRRAGVVLGVIGPDSLEEASDADIGSIHPSGWSSNRYQNIAGSQESNVYNRCHLMARCFGGRNAEENLVTGTDYMNKVGMKHFEEDIVLKYIRETGNHVLYRVTPIYKGDNKVCSGVQMEGYSIEDRGAGVCFNVYCYNIQPGIRINYATGDNWKADNITGSSNAIPFAVANPNKNNPDLIYEMNEQLKILFEDQQKLKSNEYISMMNEINEVANEARLVANSSENDAQRYIKMKKCQYKYFEVLKRHIPRLLEREEFFNKAFK